MAKRKSARRVVEEELRAREAHYRLLADNATDVIWTLERSSGGGWHFTYLSPSVTRVLGFTVEEAMAIDPTNAISTSSWDLAARLDAERTRKELAGDKEGSSPLTLELEIFRKDGSVIWAETAVTPLLDDSGLTVGVLGVTRDVTERKKAEETLQSLYKQEKELRQQIQAEMDRRVEFTRALAHELKTPLTPILASVDSLLSELKDDRLLSLARNISRGASNLNSRIDELLDLARGEVGMLQINAQSIDILPLLHEVGETIAPLAARHGQRLLTDLPDSLPPIRADAARIH